MSSKPVVDPVLEQLQQQAAAAALPSKIEDDIAYEMKFKLQKCLTRNSWYFTAGRSLRWLVS